MDCCSQQGAAGRKWYEWEMDPDSTRNQTQIAGSRTSSAGYTVAIAEYLTCASKMSLMGPMGIAYRFWQ